MLLLYREIDRDEAPLMVSASNQKVDETLASPNRKRCEVIEWQPDDHKTRPTNHKQDRSQNETLPCLHDRMLRSCEERMEEMC